MFSVAIKEPMLKHEAFAPYLANSLPGRSASMSLLNKYAYEDQSIVASGVDLYFDRCTFVL
jgi:hypothetical protein